MTTIKDDLPLQDDATYTNGAGLSSILTRIDLNALTQYSQAQGRPTIIGTVAVIGLGYVGLPTALQFIHSGFSVLGIDLSASRRASIRHLDVDLLPSERARLKAALDSGRLVLTASDSALDKADAVIICVPTPIDDHLVPDLAAVHQACRTAVAHIHPGQLLILTSTSYVGTTRDELIAPIEATGLTVGSDLNVAFSPERIDPGVNHNHQVVPRVVGGATPTCTRRAAELFESAGSQVHVVSDPETAELTKLIENTFRAANIALANEFSVAAGALGVDIMEAIAAATTKPYGYMPFYPGPGVGGHCIPCDPHYLRWQLQALRVGTPLLDEVMASIAHRPHHVVVRSVEVLAELGVPLRNARVLLLGVTYKANVADIRESPALEILAGLQSRGITVSYYDPLVPELPFPRGRPLRSVTPDQLAVLDAWDLTVVHTLHDGSDRLLPQTGLVLDATYRLREPKERLRRP